MPNWGRGMERIEVSQMRQRDTSFTPEFLASLTILELVKLQHELRSYVEDQADLDAILQELKTRQGTPK